jgi:hypothetical protein
MKNEFTPYDRALKLKQFGFDEPCFGYYIELVKPVEGILTIEKCDKNIDGLLAPTFSQAFRWFRENEFLIHFSSHDVNIHDFYIKWSPEKSILSDAYDTYEEAELACLDKLIEIVESKQEER